MTTKVYSGLFPFSSVKEFPDFKAALPWKIMASYSEYMIDLAQRQALFLDVMRKRGNGFVEMERKGLPPVLAFDYDIIVDGRGLEKPVNYALVQIRPPEDFKSDPTARPYIIVDPRAGHGAGIGGSKKESQVGVALRAGHPVYFVIFFPNPEPGQTILDVCLAEQVFARAVAERHPNAPKPVIEGNCQGGWAVMMLAASQPDITGPIVINGAPLSYWAGVTGKNPMRYTGGLSGGSWGALLAADLGNGKFDGANLVMNFESLNPANTFWKKYYNLYSQIDTEEQRFLDFERWWGGFYLMNEEEIRWIVDNLFIGNKFSAGQMAIDGTTCFNIRNIRSPIIVFASAGDNITPPQQALNWIADVYSSAAEIKASGQVICYLLHKDIGHLGIFVSGKIAQKEHNEIVGTLEVIESAAPGLYELIITEKSVVDGQIHYSVALAEREISDILALDSDGREDEEPFIAAARVSEVNEKLYTQLIRPVVKAATNENSAKLCRSLHPLRAQRSLLSDSNPAVWAVGPLAEAVRAARRPVSEDNPLLKIEQAMSDAIVQSLDTYRDIRDNAREAMFHLFYGSMRGLVPGSAESKAEPVPAARTALADSPEVRRILGTIAEGGYAAAVIRMMILLADARGTVRRSRLQRSDRLLHEDPAFAALSESDIKRIIFEQTLIVELQPDAALTKLVSLLPDAADAERALSMVEAVAGPIEEMEERTIAMFARMRDALGCQAPLCSAPSEAA
jgi:poly(3-hydroxyalkanoate) synthetase